MRLFDPLEMDLPDIGLITMRDAETGEQIVVDTHDRGFRKRFKAAAERRESELREGLARAGVDTLELATDDDLADAILRFADLRKQRSRLANWSGPKPARLRHIRARPPPEGTMKIAPLDEFPLARRCCGCCWRPAPACSATSGCCGGARRPRCATPAWPGEGGARRAQRLAPARAAGAAAARDRRAAARHARPAAPSSRCRRQQQTIMLAMDVSGSMRATDVQPNRLVASQEAAKAFVADLPRNVRVARRRLRRHRPPWCRRRP